MRSTAARSTTARPTARGNCQTSLKQALDEVVAKYADVVQEVTVYEMLDQPDMAGVERFFGVCYVLGNCKPTAATVAQFGAMSGGGTPPPTGGGGETPPPTTLPPGNYTINGTVTLTPAPAK